MGVVPVWGEVESEVEVCSQIIGIFECGTIFHDGQTNTRRRPALTRLIREPDSLELRQMQLLLKGSIPRIYASLDNRESRV